MSTPVGKSILQSLGEFQVRRWFTAAFPDLVAKIISAEQAKNEIISGGVVTAGGSITASVLQINMTALSAFLKGRLMAAVAAQTNADLFTTAGAIAQAIFTSGATAAAISLATSEKAHVTLVVCNTNGAGGKDQADNGTPKLLAIVNGSATGYGAKTTFATSTEIQAAILASTGVHAGLTGWAHVCDILWDENAGVPTSTITLNRNNVIAAR